MFSGLIGTDYELVKKLLSEKIVPESTLVDIFGSLDSMNASSPINLFPFVTPKPDYVYFSIGNGVNDFPAIKTPPDRVMLEKLLRPVNIRFDREILDKQTQNYTFLDRSGGHIKYFWDIDTKTFLNNIMITLAD
jgi:hypothetical protein